MLLLLSHRTGHVHILAVPEEGTISTDLERNRLRDLIDDKELLASRPHTNASILANRGQPSYLD